jgi:hypothetical protein
MTSSKIAEPVQFGHIPPKISKAAPEGKYWNALGLSTAVRPQDLILFKSPTDIHIKWRASGQVH